MIHATSVPTRHLAAGALVALAVVVALLGLLGVLWLALAVGARLAVGMAG